MSVDYDNAINLSSLSTGLPLEEQPKNIGTVYLTGGGFINRAFSGWGSNSIYGWQEMVWEKNPTRSRTFKFTDMDNIPVGLVARCEISTEYMNIQDYRDLRKIVGRERHFLATFFDSDEAKWVTRDVYCSENSKNQLFILKEKLIGMRGITIKLVGTNLDLTTTIDANGQEVSVENQLHIVYNIDVGTGSVTTQTVSYGGNVQLDSGDGIAHTNPNVYHLDHWETRDSNSRPTGAYGLGQKITVWKGLTLYPVYKSVSE